jgi:hypothetical protein
MAFTSLSDLRKSRGGFDNLMKEVDKISQPAGGERKEDDRLWQPTVDKAGNGYAVIRFLPPPKGEELPWVRVWNHGFQGPTGKWYIENSLTTIGKPDPVSELNNELWNSGSEANKEIARKQKRRLAYVCNVLVVSDPANPQNEGTVKLYKFGKKIFDKIKDVMQPQFQDEEPLNPFDFWKGADFKIKIRQVEGYRNYDKSEFDKPKAISEDDADIEKIWSAEHSLTDFLDVRHFKSYDELKKKLEQVLNATGASVRAEAADLERPRATPVATSGADRVQARAAAKPAIDEEDDDESLSYFSKLAADD